MVKPVSFGSGQCLILHLVEFDGAVLDSATMSGVGTMPVKFARYHTEPKAVVLVLRLCTCWSCRLRVERNESTCASSVLC